MNHTRTETHLLSVAGQRIRVSIRRGVGVPVVLCNGIGAGYEVLEPVVDVLDRALTLVRFDVPGAGASPRSLAPYRFPYLAWMLGRVLDQLGLGVVDVVGLSWGGALAQQFAFQNPRRCRRLVLVATGTGTLMVPGRPRVLAKMLTPRRFTARISGEIYGGSARQRGELVADIFDTQVHAGSGVGYLHQLLAGALWTSLPLLPAIRQATLVVAGTDDPIVPVVNSSIMHRLLPHSSVYRHPGGHIDLIADAPKLVPVVEQFLRNPRERP